MKDRNNKIAKTLETYTNKNSLKEDKAITLIALVITIIIISWNKHTSNN